MIDSLNEMNYPKLIMINDTEDGTGPESIFNDKDKFYDKMKSRHLDKITKPLQLNFMRIGLEDELYTSSGYSKNIAYENMLYAINKGIMDGVLHPKSICKNYETYVPPIFLAEAHVDCSDEEDDSLPPTIPLVEPSTPPSDPSKIPEPWECPTCPKEGEYGVAIEGSKKDEVVLCSRTYAKPGITDGSYETWFYEKDII